MQWESGSQQNSNRLFEYICIQTFVQIAKTDIQVKNHLQCAPYQELKLVNERVLNEEWKIHAMFQFVAF